MKEGADWLKHDTDMRNDPKIKALRRKFRHEGYSIWNMLLEVLARAEEFEVKMNTLQIELLAGDFDCEPGLLYNIIEYAIHIELLSKDVTDNIFSTGLKKRLTGMVEKRTRLKTSYELKKMEKQNSAAENRVKLPILPQKIELEENSAAENTQSRVEESRVEYKEEYIYTEEEKVEVELAKEILIYFGFTETANYDKLRIVGDFIFLQKNSGRLEYFTTQYRNYKLYKELSKEIKHNFTSYFGDQKERFANGKWDEANWEKKIIEFKPKLTIAHGTVNKTTNNTGRRTNQRGTPFFSNPGKTGT